MSARYWHPWQPAVDTSRKSCASCNATLLAQGSHG